MSIVSPIFILSIISPNEPKWYNPENSGLLDTALSVRTRNQSLAESSVSKPLARLYLWKTAWHSDSDWWPAYKLGTFSRLGLL